jgi:hypothetical protein
LFFETEGYVPNVSFSKTRDTFYVSMKSSWPGVVAYSCNLATWRPGVKDGLRTGVLVFSDLRRPDVCTKLGINMGAPGEPGAVRLVKKKTASVV